VLPLKSQENIWSATNHWKVLSSGWWLIIVFWGKNKGKVILVLNYLSTTSWTCMGSRGIAPPFYTWTLDGGEWTASAPPLAA
jgi:hypothetical protein